MATPVTIKVYRGKLGEGAKFIQERTFATELYAYAFLDNLAKCTAKDYCAEMPDGTFIESHPPTTLRTKGKQCLGKRKKSGHSTPLFESFMDW